MYVTGETNTYDAGGCVETSFFDKEGRAVGTNRGCFEWLWDGETGSHMLYSTGERYLYMN
jgi:hypothetical protein